MYINKNTCFNDMWYRSSHYPTCGGGWDKRTSNTKVEYLKLWLVEAQYKECTDGNLWRNVAKLIQAEFRDENLEEETVWKSVVFLSKRGGYLHSISLVRVIWKTIDITMDHQLGESMVFHDVIPKFQSNHGTGTASIKEKLLHKIAVMCKGVMVEICPFTVDGPSSR